MKTVSRESLELLRQRIDLIDVLSGFVRFQKSGAYYKGLCPFHDEKTASFVVQKGDSHYHCFGCGAHGDAIAFMMNFQKLTFFEAVEALAEKFNVPLEYLNQETEKELVNKNWLKEAMEKASRFYHFLLLNSKEGQQALEYLYQRGYDLKFLKTFQIGLSVKDSPFLKAMYEQKISKATLEEVGLIKPHPSGHVSEFFTDRIMIPIRDFQGHVIGFSARKYKEKTQGPKYINTPETPLFKKSRILFGLNYSRRNIAKEKKAIIVEGQFDALRLIYNNFAIAIAGQGTAFTEEHVKELMNLGVAQVYLAFDSDQAGQQATFKAGNLFQKEAIEVRIVELPIGLDPDTYLTEEGPKAWEKLLENSVDYLTFLVKKFEGEIDANSPSGKNLLVKKLTEQIRSWEHPLMVHESLRRVAKLLHVPENLLNVKEESPNILIKKSMSVNTHIAVDPDKILETDFLRWLFLMGEANEHFIRIAIANLSEEHFKITICRHLYCKYIEAYKDSKPRDLLSLAIGFDDAELQIFLSEIVQKKINKEKGEEIFLQTVQKLLDRYWMEEREKIKQKIHSGKLSDDEVLKEAQKFDDVKKNRPTILS